MRATWIAMSSVLIGCAASVGDEPGTGDPASGEKVAKVESAMSAPTTPITDDGNGCYGACGSGCSFCYSSSVDVPYACPDGKAGNKHIERLICPTAPCCVQHDGCTRGCGWDLECQAACNAIATGQGCLPALVGQPVPDQSWIEQSKKETITGCGTTYTTPCGVSSACPTNYPFCVDCDGDGQKHCSQTKCTPVAKPTATAVTASTAI